MGAQRHGVSEWGGGCCCLKTYKKYKCYRFPLCKLLIYKDLNKYLTDKYSYAKMFTG